MLRGQYGEDGMNAALRAQEEAQKIAPGIVQGIVQVTDSFELLTRASYYAGLGMRLSGPGNLRAEEVVVLSRMGGGAASLRLQMIHDEAVLQQRQCFFGGVRKLK
jgi:hypothetical protein